MGNRDSLKQRTLKDKLLLMNFCEFAPYFLYKTIKPVRPLPESGFELFFYWTVLIFGPAQDEPFLPFGFFYVVNGQFLPYIRDPGLHIFLRG